MPKQAALLKLIQSEPRIWLIQYQSVDMITRIIMDVLISDDRLSLPILLKDTPAVSPFQKMAICAGMARAANVCGRTDWEASQQIRSAIRAVHDTALSRFSDALTDATANSLLGSDGSSLDTDAASSIKGRNVEATPAGADPDEDLGQSRLGLSVRPLSNPFDPVLFRIPESRLSINTLS